MRPAHLASLAAVASAILACAGTGSDTTSTGGSAGTGGGTQDTSIESSAGAPQGGSGGVAGDGGCDPQVQGKSAACKACFDKAVTESCAESSKACAADPGCVAIIDCTTKCKDAACQADCIAKPDAGTSTLFPYVGCLDAVCHDECYCTDCRFGTPMCNPCLTQKCATECGGCDKNAACMAFAYCIGYRCADPNDTACQEGCIAEFDSGMGPYDGLGKCGQSKCKTECGF